MKVETKSQVDAESVTTYISDRGAFLSLGRDCDVWFSCDDQKYDASIDEIDAMVSALGDIKAAFEAKKAQGGAS